MATTQTDALIARAYELVPDTDRWDDVIASFARLIGGDSAIVYIKPSLLPGVGVLASFGVDFSATLPTYLSY